MPRLRTTLSLAVIACACFITVNAEADTCAGHRSFYLGYGGGAPRRASPFAGTMNPRYANGAHIGGPISMSGPTDYLARQAAFAPQLPNQQPQLEAQPVEYASDIELMHDGPAHAGEGLGQGQGEDVPEQVAPDYPGQFAAAAAEGSPPRRPAVPAANRTASRPRPIRPVGQGAFNSPASVELARALGQAF